MYVHLVNVTDMACSTRGVMLDYTQHILLELLATKEIFSVNIEESMYEK